jgi:hypothetical protein
MRVSVLNKNRETKMKNIFVVIIVLFSTSAIADDYVNGYTKSNGTYVQPHYRSGADSTNINNYSTKGNTNPYTGTQGTVEPNYQSYGNSSHQQQYDNGSRQQKSGYGYGR